MKEKEKKKIQLLVKNIFLMDESKINWPSLSVTGCLIFHILKNNLS